MSGSGVNQANSRCPACGAAKEADQSLCAECLLIGERARRKSELDRIVDEPMPGGSRSGPWAAVLAVVAFMLLAPTGMRAGGLYFLGIMTMFGLMLTIATDRHASQRMRWIAGSSAGIVLLILFWCMITGWDPKNSARPWMVWGTFYLLAASPLVLLLFLPREEPRQSWQCRGCGYPLFGLSEPRCPECGMAFDPARIPSRSPVQTMEDEDEFTA